MSKMSILHVVHTSAVYKTGYNVQELEVSEDRADVCVGMVGCDFTLSCFSRPRPSFDLPHFAFAKRARVRVRVRVRVTLG